MLASHGGTNVQSVVQACSEGRLPAEPALIISNNRDSAVLEFGRSRGVPSVWIVGAAYEDQALRDEAICTQLSNYDVDVVLLLGYMRKLGPATLGCFRNRILNIHPALLPKHGGKGKYGIHVHESVLASGDTETGVSIHLVDAEYDQGPVIAQCRVSVLNNDTPATLQARVLAREHEFLVETLNMIVIGSIRLI
jgi:phosphoribosylglycinamide formyltransferase, formyltetrahydrofolate-dependent